MANAERRYDHVVFDLDGTLVDSRADLVAAVNHALGEMGLAALPFDTVCAYIGEGAHRLLEQSLGSAADSRVDEAVRRFLPYYGAHLLDRTVPYPGIPETLSALARAGALLSVATNKPEAMSRAILDGLGLASCFRAVVGPDTVGARKPDPAALRRVMESCGSAPEQTLFVGDSGIDVATARAAQVDFCGVAWGIRPHELRAAGARIVAAPAELLDVVRCGLRPPIDNA